MVLILFQNERILYNQMNYRIEKTSAKSAYLQLYEQLRRDIVNGVYAIGDKLPSKRLLSEEAEISVITVEHAYAILSDEGYVESRERSGYFVIYREDDFFSPADDTKEKTQELPLGAHMLTKEDFPFSLFARTMRRVLSEYGERILLKSPNQGCPEFRKAISAYLARSRGMRVRPEQIVIGSGAEYLYSLIVQLLGKERIFAIESPSYEKIRAVYEANGVSYDMLKMGKDGIRSDELAQTKATVLHVTPFNSYPSHVTVGASKKNEYLSFAKNRGGFLIEDNYDSELTVSSKYEDTLFSLSDCDNVLYLNTFSQTVSPGIRVGYLVLPPSLLPAFHEKLGFYSCTVPVFEQYVLSEWIESGDFERHINRIRRARRKESAI